MKITQEELDKLIEKKVAEALAKEKEQMLEITPTPPKEKSVEKKVREDVVGDKEPKEKIEPYVCGGCSYEAEKEFTPCPKCGKKLSWN